VLIGTAVPRPRDCTFSPGDWEILGRYWHPVLFSTDVADTPVKARLLDVDLVVYRTSKGVVAARDLCMHRGSPLSMGHLQETKSYAPTTAGDTVHGVSACGFHPSLPRCE